jgi:hypothetical protein
VLRMSRTHATAGAIGPVHRGRLAQRWSAVHARLSVHRLDVELANGADPWNSPELMARAVRIGSLEERRRLAAALSNLVGRAQAHRATSPSRVPLRNRLVLEHSEELLLLAERLRELVPVNVNSLAELALLVRDGGSPVYAGGRPPNELGRVMVRALDSLGFP